MEKKYKEYKKLDLPKFEAQILEFWNSRDIFKKSVDLLPEDSPYVFYEGPPSANGMPGIHHVLSRTIKDLFCRYKTLKGFRVNRKGGWDTHGLPVELEVEKEMGITKEDIGKVISVEDYNKRCRETVMKYKKDWEDLTQKMGYWIDLDNPYLTFDNEYIESLWHILKELYQKDLLYKGYSVQPYSPAAGTGLSSHELNLPGCYRDVKDASVVAQFKIKRNETSEFLYEGVTTELYFLAWTTTAWTLPANCALAVGKNISYIKVETTNQYTQEPITVILAEDLFEKYFPAPGDGSEKQAEATVIGRGETLEGVKYEQLLPYVQPDESKGEAFRVILGDFVSTEEGTGIVHTASVFGSDDFRVCQANNVPSILVQNENNEWMPLVDKQGRFVKEVTDFAGMYVRVEYYSDEEQKAEDFLSTDIRIVIKLKEENKAFKTEKYVHSYPHCWRTDKPVIYYPLDSWFIRTTKLKDRLIELNKTINWKPASTGSGRFETWLNNLVDWNLSRTRFWGTPLPIWRSEDGKEEICIGSMEELHAEVAKALKAGFMDGPLSEDFDLHRPYVDDVFLVSPSGAKMTREADLIDVWFDSGAMPYAQWHYPFENKELFEKNFPADFIAEGVDQTRGWFFTLHTISTMISDSVAYKNVISNGLVLDKEGNKMSKRVNNVVDPFETIAALGADATRWYMIANAQPWDNIKFDLGGIQKVQRKFFGTLFNTYAFFALYANIDGFRHSEELIPMEKRPEIDRWIISLKNSLVEKVEAYYEDYEPTKAARAIQEFVDDNLSNWYIRLSRRRFWKGSYSDDKIAAYQTLYECLEAISQMMAPVSPFFSDFLFRNLNEITGLREAESVHLSRFPTVDTNAIDTKLEERMKIAQDISSMALSLRKKSKIKVRQPLSKILVPVLNEADRSKIEQVRDLILSEVNVKKIEFVDDTAGIITKNIKPNFKKLGRKWGPKMKSIAAVISNFTQEDISRIEIDQQIEIEVDKEKINILLEETEIKSEDIPGWLVANTGSLTIALDINLTQELTEEGNAREFVNKIQKLRKEQGFEVTDRVSVEVQSDDAIKTSIINFKDYICREILAVDIALKDKVEESTLIEINDNQVKVNVSKTTQDA